MVARKRNQATRGTGPRTEAGKAISSQNAWRHGFSSASPGPATWADAASLYDEISDRRQALLADIEMRLDEVSQSDAPDVEGAFINAVNELHRLERYLSRAFTKRQTAARKAGAEPQF